MKYATLGSLLSIVLLCAFGGVGLAQAPAPAPSQPTKTVRAVQNFATVTDQVIAAPKPKDWLVHRGARDRDHHDWLQLFLWHAKQLCPSAHDGCAVSDYRTGPILDLGLKSSFRRFGSR